MEKTPSILSIESEADYEGNASLLLFECLRSVRIREQIVDLLLRDENSRIGTFVESLKIDSTGNLVLDDAGEPIIEERKPFVSQTREDLEKQYDEILKNIESVTDIKFNAASHEFPNQEAITIDSVAPWSGKPFDAKQMSLIEAHEKGHHIRPYYASEFLEDYFHKAFNFDAVPYGEAEAAIFKRALPPEEQGKSLEEIKQMFFEYLSSPAELAERMSQLKNYFGMKGETVFTKEHLEYARSHYIPDTGLDNGMTQFFQAITPEKANAFLEIINSAGI